MKHTQTMIILAASTLLVSASALSACQLSVCTAMGCGLNGIEVNVQRDGGGSFPAGHYALTLDLGSEGIVTIDCDYDASDPPFTCYDSVEPGLHLEIGGSPAMVVRWNGTWDQVATEDPFRVTITQDGSTIVDETYPSNFDVSFPNGEQCGPTCYTQTETASASTL